MANLQVQTQIDSFEINGVVDAYLKKTKNVEIETVEQTVGLDFFFQMLMLNARNNLIYITLSQSISCMLSRIS